MFLDHSVRGGRNIWTGDLVPTNEMGMPNTQNNEKRWSFFSVPLSALFAEIHYLCKDLTTFFLEFRTKDVQWNGVLGLTIRRNHNTWVIIRWDRVSRTPLPEGPTLTVTPPGGRNEITKYHHKNSFQEQECIPVGCVPPGPYRTGVSVRWGVCLTETPWTGTPPDRELSGQTSPVQTPPGQIPPLDRYPPGQRPPPRQRLILDRQPLGQTNPWTDTPWTDTPWTDTPGHVACGVCWDRDPPPHEQNHRQV